ncbi:MAG: hypothetical protein AMS15_05090 [Planctomycetes bacterium DG_23]|nr:MAG: hypothetical protein AMS15_05090 [Planctomycetes bacterium DG_23]
MEDIIGPKTMRNLRKYIGPVIGIIFILIFALTIFYSVGADEVGVIQRFGRYTRTTEPGLHLKLPFGIEKATKVKVKYIFKNEFGFRTLRPGIKTVRAPEKYLDESLMLSGDLNSLVVEWIVQFKVKDPVKLLFNIRDPSATVGAISEAVMRQVVGDHSVSEALTTRRVEVNLEVEKKLQEILDSYNSGIHIVTVKLQDVNPPDEVKPAFNDVNEAKQERERMINEAWEAYNKVIPRAKGEAEKTIRKAEGYALNRVNSARGDAHKFLAIWEEYKDAKEVTRRRLYLETLAEVLPEARRKYILDSSQQGILPLLRLDEEGGGK